MDAQEGLQIDIAQLTIESPDLILKVAKKLNCKLLIINNLQFNFLLVFF
jgi:hypothetical protein